MASPRRGRNTMILATPSEQVHPALAGHAASLMYSEPDNLPFQGTFQEKRVNSDHVFEEYGSSSDALLSSEGSCECSRAREQAKTRVAWTWVAQAAFFMISLTIFVSSLISYNRTPHNCTQKVSSPSPALDAMTDDDYEYVHFNTTLNTFGEFTGNYTDEKAQKWLDITATPVITVSEADMIRAGASLDSVRVPESAGGGYLAQLEGFHTLHCLRVLWYDHHSDEIPGIKKSKAENSRHYEAHYEHCVDIIRQNLMCHFDASFATFNWLVNISEPFPYFANPKKCRKFDKFMDWTHEHKFRQPDGFVWKAPDDAHFVRVVDRVAQWDEPRVDKDGNELR